MSNKHEHISSQVQPGPKSGEQVKMLVLPDPGCAKREA